MKENLYVETTADKVYKKKLIKRIASIALCILLLLLTITYAIVYVVNVGGNFTITLDPNISDERNIVASNREDFAVTGIKFQAVALPYMTNIAEAWIDKNVDEIDGPHNGENYMAYTFYLKNAGTQTVDYYADINILSVIKNVDDAVRVAVYKNGEKEVYAKKSSYNNEPERGTIAFDSNTKVMIKHVKNFSPGDVDKYTIVIWLEGDDPECIDNILGGEIKMEMVIREIHND